jgi:hypothetical protein
MKTQTVQKALNSRKKHEETPKTEVRMFEHVCHGFRVFLCLFVAIAPKVPSPARPLRAAGTGRKIVRSGNVAELEE